MAEESGTGGLAEEGGGVEAMAGRCFTAVTEANLTPGQTRCVEVAGRSLIAARAADGAVHVFDRHCSHLSLDMARGRVRGDAFVCPHHGAKFDMATGAVLGPPASASIGAYAARERDGWIEAELGG